MSPNERRGSSYAALLLLMLLALVTAACGGDDPIRNEPLTCSSGEVDCGGACVATGSDPNHCGACDNACAPGEVCSSGACGTSCPSGLSECGGSCANLQSDNQNCGACDNACAPGEVCSAGKCALTCQASLTECGGVCSNLQTDNTNCGDCGVACDPGEVCSAGSCALTCQASLTDCGGVCANIQTDNANCGACNNPCAPGEVCSAGSCALTCQASLTDCGGLCTNTDTDFANCGACGNPCAPGEVCSAGACATSCQAGLEECAGLCVNFGNNPQHCGACGAPCAVDEVCSAGSCVGTTPVTLQFLQVSDWHGQLDPLSVNGVDIGGAAVLSSYFKAERMANPNTITLTAGDAYGASPPLSSFFNEEPAVMAMNLMGFDVDTFGNHNFDRGIAHLQSMIDLAKFKYVSSNLKNLSMNLSGVAEPYHLLTVGGVKVAVIGITNPDAPDLTSPGFLGTITIGDPAASAMAARSAAEAAGARVFIAIAHLGASSFDAASGTYGGKLLDFASGLSGFHAVFGDHTDFEVNTVVNGALVVENKSKGRTYSRVELEVVPYSGALVSSSVTFITPVKSAVVPDQAIETMLAPYRANLTAALDGVIGVATDIFPRGNNIERLMEVAIGDLIADAFRTRYSTDIAFMNGGGIRAPLPSSYLPADMSLRRTTPGYAMGPPYDLVKGDVYTVLPFGNAVITRTVTGAQLWEMLENSVSALPAAAGKFGQISGFKFTYKLSNPVGTRVLSVELDNGTPILANSTTYSIATLDFLNTGGDGYTMLADGMGVTRDLAAEVLIQHIETLGTITPMTFGRITEVP
jgi:5'-nucleotidase